MWKLMHDEVISLSQREKAADFILTAKKLTNGEKVKQFEKEWSQWQGCKHSVFVNSGSSANLILVAAIKEMYGTSGVVSQSVTWSTTVSPLMQLGFDLQLCDISLKNFSPDLSNLEQIFSEDDKVKLCFLTHVLGFNSISNEFLSLLKKYNIVLIEDCCEATGASFNGIKVGNFGVGSTFSFYYGHHFSTIEGGMVCTNNDEVYDILLSLRSHGLSREMKNPPVSMLTDPRFTFVYPGFNVRNTEISAVIGLDKINSLDEIIKTRNNNLDTFLSNLNKSKFFVDFDVVGSSNFALPIISKENTENVEMKLKNFGIEYRPIISGSLYRQPFMKKVKQKIYDTNAEYVHKNGFYVGNNEQVSEDMVVKLCKCLNS